jgi:hypothetical protein
MLGALPSPLALMEMPHTLRNIIGQGFTIPWYVNRFWFDIKMLNKFFYQLYEGVIVIIIIIIIYNI